MRYFRVVAIVVHRRPAIFLSIVLVLSVLVLAILNPLHEWAHFTGWKLQRIPSCMLYNKTMVEGDVEKDPRFIWGLIAAPLFNLLFGIAFAVPYCFVSKWRVLLFVIVACAWVTRPVVILTGLLPRQSSDELQLFENLSMNYGIHYAWLALLVLIGVPIVSYTMFAWRTRALGCRNKLIISGAVILGIVFVLPLLMQILHIKAIPWIGPIGPLCSKLFDL